MMTLQNEIVEAELRRLARLTIHQSEQILDLTARLEALEAAALGPLKAPVHIATV